MDSNVVTTILKNNIGNAIRYSQKKPFNIYLNNSLQDSTCVIEFSSKILLDRYPELINKNNIHACFENLNNIGFCDIDVNGIIRDSKLLSCDITQDLEGVSLPDKLAINSCLKNTNKFKVQKYGNSGHTITKMVKTKNRQIRLSIYDKVRELKKMTNAEFLGLLDDKDALMAYFDGKFRFEANVNTKQQILQLFQIESNNLLDVLNSHANPLLALYDQVFIFLEEPDHQPQKMPSPLSYTKLSAVKNALLLEACEYDIEKVDHILNKTLSPYTNKRKYRADLKGLLNSYPLPNNNIKVMKKIREELENGDS